MIPNHILDAVKHLDPLPVTARRLSSMLGNENVNIREIAEIVEYDVAVAANIVRVANSAEFGCW